MTSKTPKDNTHQNSPATQSAELEASGQETQQMGSDADFAHTDSNQTKAPDEQFCESCGSVIKKEADICPECGVRNHQSTGGGGNKSPAEPMGRLAAAGIGGLVAFFASVIPLVGHIGGGVVAGYLRGDDRRESTICGAYAGSIASIPTVLLFGLLFFIGAIGGASEGAGSFIAVVVGGVVVIAFVTGIYAGLGALGGYIGAAITNRGTPDV